MPDRTFHEIELESWSQRARLYDSLFAEVSMQAIVPTLNSLGELTGKRLLDIACGTGHLVAAMAQRGAISEGIDFAQAMVEVARKNYPDQCFKVADATELPYEDDSFDAISCCFGLSHMENPQAAAEEAFRVLKRGGRFAFTLWFDADSGAELLAIGREAVTRYATQTIEFPKTWTRLRFADTEACESIVRNAGFNQPTFLKIPILIQSTNAQTMLDIFVKLSVRTRMIIDSQSVSAKQHIYEYILSEVEARRIDGLMSLAWPALLTVAEKPQ